MRAVTLLAVLCLWCSHSHGLRIDKSTGAYEDIVIAIHPSVEPDERIIDNIKALFRSASTFLHRATRGLVHFGSVTIAVPDTWPARQEAKSTAASLFPVADVRVAAENPQYGDTPYTLQPRGCGERGEYVHLTPRFLSEMNDSIAEAYGSPAYLLVHEWAHFRYGVFDEYGDPESFRYPSLYCESGMVRATACSEHHKFSVYTDSGQPCRIYKGCRVSSKCKTRFEQHSQNPVTSSIMFMPYVKGVTDFCDGANNTHNAFAPTKHNHLCERKSTWEVISANEDFKDLTPGDLEEVAEVKFTVVQKREGTLGRVIFALDISGSMAMHNRIENLNAAMSRFAESVIPDGLEVGVVLFDTRAYTKFPLTIVEESTRRNLVKSVKELVIGASTCIGCALRLALQMFEENGQRVEGSVIILMTDGEESEAPKIDDVMDELIAAQVVVNTIAFGTQAEEKLEELALRTGGKPFALREGQSNVPVAIESAFLDSAFALLDESKRPVVIFDQQADVAEERKFSILVDADLGNETTVVLQSKEASKLKAVLLYPDGKTCEDCLVSGPAVSGNYVNFKIPGIATPGTWTLVVSQDLGSGEVAVHVRATSLARYPDEKPVMVRAFLKRTEVDSAAQAAVYAEVTKGEYVVLHAKVTATVVRPQGHGTVEMELFDDGLGADVTANDGIYSGYFTQFDGVGRYSVSARVVSGDDSVIVQGRQASGGLPAPQVSALPSGGAPESTDEVDGIPLERFVYVDQDIEEAEPRVLRSEKAPEFERYAEGGSFRLTNEVDDSTIPPNSIQDLKVEDAFMDVNGTHVVILTWTCPGAHMNSDNASQVELRGSTRIVDVINHFDSAFAVSEDYAADGKIPAGAVGSRQRLRFHLADALLAVAKNDSRRDFYFAARVWNDDGLFSPVSNLVRVTFKRPQPHTKGTTWWIISLGVLAAVFVVLALVIVARKIGRWRRTSGSVTSIVA
ncbi:calcium-activated chloride channel regulator 1-like isoform X3 [Dermacentor andersoni]|uniref:calcium-activated chloride channel regulator 1-like isoform X3 n=1 Tax=Dermacentor andersoni TaxID=34620 RepID=UPI003B3A8416